MNVLPAGLVEYTNQRPLTAERTPLPTLLINASPAITIASPEPVAVTLLPVSSVTSPVPPATRITRFAFSAPVITRFPLAVVVNDRLFVAANAPTLKFPIFVSERSLNAVPNAPVPFRAKSVLTVKLPLPAIVPPVMLKMLAVRLEPEPTSTFPPVTVS